MNRINLKIHQRGFMATIAVILIATGAIALSLSALAGAVLYADSVDKHEFRIQAGLNARACLDTVTLMAVKDYFLNGEVAVPEFGCDAVIINDGNGNVSMNITASVSGVVMRASRTLSVGDNSIRVVSEIFP